MKESTIRTLFELASFYLRRVLQRKMCHKCISLWHICVVRETVELQPEVTLVANG